MQRRDAVLRAMKDHPISQRRACVLIGVDPKTVRRERPPDNQEIREEMRKIAEKRRRFGYRRVGNGSLRDECLNEEIFDSLADARRKLAIWRCDYNNVRPHSSIGNKTPAEARRTLAQSEGSAPGALAQPETDHYQPQGLSL